MKTNKNYWILAATVLTTSLFTACNEKKQAETAEVNVPAEELTASTADEIFTTEPLTINKKGPKGTNISYQLRIDFPSQGPEQLLSSLQFHLLHNHDRSRYPAESVSARRSAGNAG